MRLRRCAEVVFLWSVLIGGAGRLPAAELPDDAYRLGEIVVSATVESGEAAGTVHTVTASDIQERGARTLDEALGLIPGLVVRTGGEGTPRIDIRGLRTRHVLLLLDGIPINSTFDGQFDPSTFGVENIAEIKVTTGGASVLYGEGGNAGVINVITRKGLGAIGGSVATEAAEGDAYLGRFTLSAGNKTMDAFVSGSAYDRSGYKLSDDFAPTASENGGERLNSDRQRKNFFANLGWAPTANTQLGLALQYRKDRYGIPPITNSDANDPFTKKEKFDRVDHLEGIAAQLAFDQKLPGPFGARGWVHYNRLDTKENRYDDAGFSTQAAKGATRSDSTTETAGVNLQLKADLGRSGTATLALIADNSDWQADGFEITGSKKAVTNTPFDLQRDVQIYTAALQYEVQPWESLGIVLGAAQHAQVRNERDDDGTSYELGIYYDPLPGTRLRANHTRKIRFPSIRQLYEVNSGNSRLSAESTLNYEAGVEQQLPAATILTVTGFLIDAQDFIEKNDATSRFENFQDYRFQGFEIAAETRAVQNLFFRVAYSYLDSEDRSSGSEKDELQHRPRDKFTVEARYRFPGGMTAQGSLLYVGNQYFYDSDNVAPLQKKQLNDYTVVDVKLSQDLVGGQVNLYAGANNLLDQDYEQSYGLPQPGRTLYAGARYRF
jgi:vitamin B12 transporter